MLHKTYKSFTLCIQILYGNCSIQLYAKLNDIHCSSRDATVPLPFNEMTTLHTILQCRTPHSFQCIQIVLKRDSNNRLHHQPRCLLRCHLTDVTSPYIHKCKYRTSGFNCVCLIIANCEKSLQTQYLNAQTIKLLYRLYSLELV